MKFGALDAKWNSLIMTEISPPSQKSKVSLKTITIEKLAILGPSKIRG